MRSALLPALVLALLVVAPLATAQQPPSDPSCPGGRGGGGFGGGGQPPQGRNFTRPDNGTRQGNGTRGGFGGEPLPELNLTFDPSGPLTLAPGATASVQVNFRNDGSASLDLTLMASSFGRRNATPLVTASLDPASGTLDPGASASATLTVTLDPSAPAGCPQMVFVTARDAATNRTAGARLVIDVPAASSGTSPAAVAATPAKKTPMEVAAPLAALALAALGPRRGGPRP